MDCRRAAVDHHQIVGFDQSARVERNALAFADVFLQAFVDPRLMPHGRPGGPAVGAVDHPELVQVAAHRLGRNIELAGELRDADRRIGAQQGNDTLMARLLAAERASVHRVSNKASATSAKP